MKPEPNVAGGSSRTAPPSPPIHWSEKAVLILLSVHLAFLPWAFGAMELWAQQVSLALAGAAFLTAVLLNPPSTRIIPKIPAWKKLLRSPSVWIGCGLLGYITVQALNPAYEQIELLDELWLMPVDHIRWLPSGMATPLEEMSPYRHLMIFGSAFLTIWTIGLFIERTQSIRILVGALALNGVALAALAFAQLFTGAEQIFWRFDSPTGNFFASFIYRNHAASYLNLVLALSTGLYFYFRERSWRLNERAGDMSPVFFFTSTVIFTAVLFSGSRGGVIVAGMILVAAILYTLFQAWRWNRLREGSVISFIFLGLLVFFASVFTAVIGPERIVDRFKHFAEDDGGGSVRARVMATQATADMFRDNWFWGWGAGSFEYAFPEYQANYPEIYYRERQRRRQTIRTYFVWDYAHNDWIQYPAEYGVAGMSFFVAGLALWGVGLWRSRAIRHPISVWATVGMLLTLGHAFGDFVLQNPATIITAGAAVALGLQNSRLESGRRKRRESA